MTYETNTKDKIDFEDENIEALAELLMSDDHLGFKMAYQIALDNKHIRIQLLEKMRKKWGGFFYGFYGLSQNQGNIKWGLRAGSDEVNYIVRTFNLSKFIGDVYLLRVYNENSSNF